MTSGWPSVTESLSPDGNVGPSSATSGTATSSLRAPPSSVRPITVASRASPPSIQTVTESTPATRWTVFARVDGSTNHAAPVLAVGPRAVGLGDDDRLAGPLADLTDVGADVPGELGICWRRRRLVAEAGGLDLDAPRDRGRSGQGSAPEKPSSLHTPYRRRRTVCGSVVRIGFAELRVLVPDRPRIDGGLLPLAPALVVEPVPDSPGAPVVPDPTAVL